jgi:hypothetical protein
MTELGSLGAISQAQAAYDGLYSDSCPLLPKLIVMDLKKLAFCLKPVLQLVTGPSLTRKVNLISTLADLFVCRCPSRNLFWALGGSRR